MVYWVLLVKINVRIFKVYSDSFFTLENIFQESFFIHNNISCVVNCIGSYRNPNQYYSSNFLTPLYITNFLNKFSASFNKSVTLFHLSSVGITSPYVSFSLNYTPHSPFLRPEVSVDSYEFSKLVFDTFLSTLV